MTIKVTKPAINVIEKLNSGANLVGRTDSPSFSVYAGSHLYMPNDDTWYKTIYSNEQWDSHDCISQGSETKDNRFICPPGHAGKYMFNYGAHMTFSTGSDAHFAMKILQNGEVLHLDMWAINHSQHRGYGQWSTVIDLGVGDYVEVFTQWLGYGWDSSSLFLYGGTNCKFQGYKLT